MKELFYYFGLIQAYVLNLLMIRTKVYYEDDSKQNKKIKGKAIIISNHQSPFDGLVIIQKYFFRKIHFVLADFFQVGAKRIFAWFIRLAGGLLVDRESYNFDFFEKSKKLLSKGKIVLIFPEGRFSREYEPIRFIYSYLALSVQSGARIIPIVSDCNYGLRGRVHIIIGNSIEPYLNVRPADLTKDKLKEINEEIYSEFIRLYYLLKKKAYEKISSRFMSIPPGPGDMIRIPCGSGYHYGVYLSSDEVVQLGRADTGDCANGGGCADGGDASVNAVPLDVFCCGMIPEVRVLSKRESRYRRDTGDIIKYARFCLGLKEHGQQDHDLQGLGQKSHRQQGYNAANNDCYDFANRIVLR